MKPAHIGLLSTAGQPAVSPDGRTIAFTVTRTDVDENKYRTQVWVAAADGSSLPHPVTDGTKDDASPCWSPDGRHLAFISHRGEKKTWVTVHVMPFDGPGETVQVALAKGGATDLRWSPDGRWLVWAGDALSDRYDEEDPKKQPPRRIERFFSRLDNKGWVHDRPTHVFVVRADGSAAPKDLTLGEYSFGQPTWFPDSSGVVCTGVGHETWDTDLASDIYVVTLEGQRHALTKQDGQYDHPSVSPDGTAVAFLGFADPLLGAQVGRVGVLELATGDQRWLDPGLDRTMAPYPGAQSPQWDGTDVLVAYEDRGDVRIRRIPTSGGSATTLTERLSSVFGFDHAAGTLAVTSTRFDRPSELAVVHHGEERVLTDLDATLAAEAQPQDADRFTSPSSGGVEVDTWVVLPAGVDPADASAHLPVLLDVHGGPLTQYGNKYFDEAQMQAGAGYVVVMCNPRGSSGREEAWGQAILGPLHPTRPGTGWGAVDVEDVLAALDESLRRFPCPRPNRIGMLGGSYGGFMATWLAGTSKRFKAICSERAVNNMYTEEFTSDISTAFISDTGVRFIDDPEEYARVSPMRFARQIDVPILIVHSEDDLRCPINQAEELFVTLRLLGKEVEFLRFPAEGHELSRSGSPIHRVQRQEAVIDFFDKHLK